MNTLCAAEFVRGIIGPDRRGGSNTRSERPDRETHRVGFGPHDPHIDFSVTKSAMGALVDTVAEAGALRLNDNDEVVRQPPEAVESAFGTARVQNLLDRSVEVTIDEGYVRSGGAFACYRRSAGWCPNGWAGLPAPVVRQFLVSLEPSVLTDRPVDQYLAPVFIGGVNDLIRRGEAPAPLLEPALRFPDNRREPVSAPRSPSAPGAVARTPNP